MEGSELQRNKQPGIELAISENEKAIIKSLVHVNMIVAFQLQLEDLTMWAKDLQRLRPEVGTDQIAFLMDCYKTEKLVWDNKVGIQNIFRGLDKIENVNGIWQLIRIWPG